MAINGQRFLRVSKTSLFSITRHALQRVEQHSGESLSLREAFERFRRSEQVTYSDLYGMGYRPGYRSRWKKGIRSWYFRLDGARELFAVITEGPLMGEYEWVTTYGRGRGRFSYLPGGEYSNESQ